MLNRIISAAILTGSLVACLSSLVRALPSEVAYQGELREHGTRFTGPAKMKFAIVRDGVSLWSNDSTSVAGSEPASSVDISVVNGIFSVYLGSAPHMKPLTSAVLSGGAGADLVLWIKTSGDFERLSPQRLASVPFALRSETESSAGGWVPAPPNIYFIGGNVGIGTDMPAAPLDIKASERVVAQFQTTHEQATLLLDGASQSLIQGGNATSDRLVLRTNASSTTGPQITMFGSTWSEAAVAGAIYIGAGSNTNGDVRLLTHGATRLRGEGTTGNVGIGTFAPSSALHVAGTTTTSVLAITGGSDLAESFTVVPDDGASSSIEPGVVLSIDPDHPGQLTLATTAYDQRVAGVLSGANGVRPAMVVGDSRNPTLAGTYNIALSGRVYVKATTANGPIQPGDPLTTSDVPGSAMRATDLSRARGAILGKAMSELRSGQGFVLLLVQPQ